MEAGAAAGSGASVALGKSGTEVLPVSCGLTVGPDVTYTCLGLSLGMRERAGRPVRQGGPEAEASESPVAGNRSESLSAGPAGPWVRLGPGALGVARC